MESEVGGLWQLEEEEHEAFGQVLADSRYDEPWQRRLIPPVGGREPLR